MNHDHIDQRVFSCFGGGFGLCLTLGRVRGIVGDHTRDGYLYPEEDVTASLARLQVAGKIIKVGQSFARDPNALAPIPYRPKCSPRRCFLSQGDADAYDRGFTGYPGEPSLSTGPEAAGYHDAAERAESRQAERFPYTGDDS